MPWQQQGRVEIRESAVGKEVGSGEEEAVAAAVDNKENPGSQGSQLSRGVVINIFPFTDALSCIVQGEKYGVTGGYRALE